jgi:hypothetical protein
MRGADSALIRRVGASSEMSCVPLRSVNHIYYMWTIKQIMQFHITPYPPFSGSSFTYNYFLFIRFKYAPCF